MSKIGIKETKEAITFLGAVTKLALGLKDGIGPADYAAIVASVTTAQAAISDWSLIDDELKDLSADEINELISHTSQSFGLEADNAYVINTVKVAKNLLGAWDGVQGLLKAHNNPA